MSDGEGGKREEFRPRVGGRGGEVPQDRVPRFRNRMLARIARIGGRSAAASSRPRGTSSARDVPRPGALARRCVIKARFVPMNAYGKQITNRALGIQPTIKIRLGFSVNVLDTKDLVIPPFHVQGVTP